VTKARAGGDVNEKERSGQQMKEEKKRKNVPSGCGEPLRIREQKDAAGADP
jgi:hypothetical protein